MQVVDKQCLDLFVQEWLLSREQEQMLGLLFGRYESRSGASGQREIALVYGLYKPKQHFADGRIVLEHDDAVPVATSVAARLGLQCIGAVFTAPPSELVLSSFDVELLAPLQWAYRRRGDFSSRFVSIVIRRNAQKAIEPSAFMLSDQCLCMYRDGLLRSPQTPELCLATTKGPRGELLSTVIRNDQKLGSQEVTQFEPLFFLVELTVTMAKANTFPVVFRSYAFPAVSSRGETKDTLLSGTARTK